MRLKVECCYGYLLLISAIIFLSYDAWLSRDDERNIPRHEVIISMRNCIDDHYLQELKYPNRFQQDDPAYCREIEIHYPQIINPTKHEQTFNAMVKDYVSDELEKYYDQSVAGGALLNMLHITYTIFFLNKDLISVRFHREIWCGWMHPYEVFASITFDRKQGRILELMDIFNKNKNYKNYLLEYSRKELMHLISLKIQANCPEDYHEKCKSAQEDVNRGVNIRFTMWPNPLYGFPPGSWNITPTELIVTFNTYEVAWGMAGPFEVVIPYGRYLNDGMKRKMVEPSITPPQSPDAVTPPVY